MIEVPVVHVRRIIALFTLILVQVAPLPAQSAPAGQPYPPLPPQLLVPQEVHTGWWRGQIVTYGVVDGRPVMEGDILLDHVQPLPANGAGPDALSISFTRYLWPKVGAVYQIPYIITNGNANVPVAIAQANGNLAGVIQWVPRTTETDYVNFNLDSNNHNFSCASYGGRIGGEQQITGSIDCTVSTLLHEMGHAYGLYHEQSRTDRDTYVSVMFQNMIKGSRGNSDKPAENVQNQTLYDYASVMHYFPLNFTRNGSFVIESIPAGIPLSNSVGYSAGDLDGLKRLYNAAPTTITVTTNPPGLQVIVDGVTVTAPQTYNWPLNSTHTLAIPANAQAQGTIGYTYGRWNDSLTANHTITVTPGNGLLGQPVTSPAVTVYQANFIRLVPFVSSVFPSGSGSVTVSPAPLTYAGLSGSYFVQRQAFTLTATPNAGQRFYEFINSPYWFYGGLSENPKNATAPDDGNGISVTTYFTSDPVYTVTQNPNANSLGVFVDGGFWYTPKNFARTYDPAWTTGSSHSLSAIDPQYPWSSNTRYAFQSWSDNGAATHNITLPTTSTTYTANVQGQYLAIDYVNQYCAGTLTVTPPSPSGDGFYHNGDLLSFSQTPAAGWLFTGWQYDLSGTANQNLTVSDEILVTADYNTVAAPLTITSLSPNSAVAGAGGFTLTITGTGFTSGTQVFFNGVFKTSTFVNSTTLTVPLLASDIAAAGGFEVFLDNFPSGALCSSVAVKNFYVASAPVVAPSPGALTFAAQVLNTTSATQAVTLTNNSGAAVSINSIATSANFAQTNTCGSTLGAGAACTINVSFTPTVSGTITGALTISDSGISSPRLVALTGSGSTPLTLSPTTLSFGTVAVGSSSAAKTVTLTNNLSTTLNLTLSTSGNYTFVGSGTSPCGATLLGKKKCTVSVTFSPKVSGSLNGALTITHNAAFSPQVVTTSGTGSGGSTAPLTFSPASLSFGTIVLAATSTAQTVTVTNSSAASVTINSLTATGNYTAAGSGTKPCGGALAAAATCTFQVTFTPTVAGANKGAVAIATTSTVTPQVYNLSGTGSAQVTFSPASLTFAAQTVYSTSATQTVTLTNNATTALSLTSITGSGDFTATSGGATPCGTSVAAKGKCTFTVSFTPTTVGPIGGAVTVVYGGGSSPQALTLTGTGASGQ